MKYFSGIFRAMWVDVARPDVSGSISDAIAYFLINYTGLPFKY